MVLYVTLLKEMPVGELVGASVGFSVKVTRGLMVVVVVDDMGAYMEPGVVVVVVFCSGWPHRCPPHWPRPRSCRRQAGRRRVIGDLCVEYGQSVGLRLLGGPPRGARPNP